MKIIQNSSKSLSFVFLEDPYFIDEEFLIERETLLTEEDKEVREDINSLINCYFALLFLS